jgi:Tfp pilus assembly protein PilX
MNHSTIRHDEQGVALVTTLLLILMFLSLGAFAMQFSGLDAKIANNHRTGTQALDVAESGLLHGLATMNRIGVTDFNADIVARWSTLFTPNPKAMAGNPQLSYQVQVAAGADAANTGTITVTASGTSRSQRVVVARVRRANSFDGRGALYLADDFANTQFSGSSFEIDGNNHDLAGNVVANGPVVPGISDRSDSVTSTVEASLNNNQIDCVRGLGYSEDPHTPSVVTGGGPGVADLDQIISDILARPGVVNVSDSSVNGGTLGTCDQPQITHLTASTVDINGNVSGCGILIAEGSVRINGTADFTGWIIVRGSTEVNATTTDDSVVLGSARIIGSLWTGDLNVKVGGAALIDYSGDALAIADQIGGGGNPVPRPMVLTSWTEVY